MVSVEFCQALSNKKKRIGWVLSQAKAMRWISHPKTNTPPPGDSSNYGAAQVGVATSPSIAGSYTWRGNFKPFGNDSRDQTVWKDPETKAAYLIYATSNNADFSIASLDSDYYTPNATLHTFPGVYWEAPGVFKIDGVFYLIFSKQDGWTPTDNFYMTATSMAGPWSEATLLAPEGSYAYLTQNAYDVVIQGSEEVTYLYYGDHWSGNQLGSSTYAFHPAAQHRRLDLRPGNRRLERPPLRPHHSGRLHHLQRNSRTLRRRVRRRRGGEHDLHDLLLFHLLRLARRQSPGNRVRVQRAEEQILAHCCWG
jgi:hypothetical protein